MARHVAEGGKPFDEFGIHIVGLSEELSKLKTFKSYMGRSSVMAEGLSGYMDVVKERVASVKKTLESLQKKAFYTETFTNYAKAEIKEVPQDVAENWIDELTVRQFNEELKDVFPYIYSLVSENTRAKTLGPMDLEGYTAYKGDLSEASVKHELQDNFDTLCQMKEEGASESQLEAAAAKMTFGGQALEACLSGADNPFGSDDYEPDFESQIEQGFDDMMGQFGEVNTNEAQDGQVGTMALFVSDQDGGEHEVEVQVKIVNGKPEIDPNTLPGPEDMLYWDDADIEQQAMDAMRDGDIEFDESFDPQSEPSKQEIELDKLNDVYEKGGEAGLANEIGLSPQELDREMSEYGMQHGLHMDDDRDDIIQGYIEELVDNMDEGDNDTMDVKIDKDGNMSKDDGKEEEQKTPLGEFILSYFDRENGQFPKGETAVLTMVEKDYGEEFITPAKKFIEMINTKVAEVMGYKEANRSTGTRISSN